MKSQKIDENTSMIKLAWPIFIELFLFMIMGNVDTLMLSGYSDLAVAAVGNANQVVNTLVILFNITGAAVGIMITQFIGAGNKSRLNQVYSLAIYSNLLLALLLGFIMVIWQNEIFGLIMLPQELYADTAAYLGVTAGFLWVPALYMICSVILKSHGNTKMTMYLAIMMNIINVCGNSIALYGHLPEPFHGVSGVAISTIIGRAIALALMFYVITRKMGCSFSLRHLKPFPKDLSLQMLKFGAPSAGEPISYQFSQMVIFAMINALGTVAITTRMYARMVVYFTYLGSLALAQASQIIVGHLAGAKKYDEAYHLILKSLKQGWLIALAVSLGFGVFRLQIMDLFTDDPKIIALGGVILLIDIVLEIGRVANLVVIGGLKAAGDVNFPMVAGIVSMWGVSTLGAWFFGMYLGYGLAGIWFAMLLDECFRAVLMIFRWKGGKWRDRLVTMKD